MCPECTRCENGVVTVLEGWRLTSSQLNFSTSSQAQRGGQPQWIFSCPYEDTDCPEIKLSATPVSSLSCPGNHNGPLCATCIEGYSRRGSSSNTCEQCHDIGLYIQEKFDITAVELIVSIAIFAAVLLLAACAIPAHVTSSLVENQTNLRILFGAAQVLSLLPSTLEIVFPPQPTAALSFLAIFVADLRSIVRFECWGLSWYGIWILEIFGMLLLAVVPVCVLWLRRRVSKREGLSRRAFHGDEGSELNAEERLVSLPGVLSFSIMLVYPQVCSSIFSALRCRRLSETSSVLEADYSVSCFDQRYLQYRLVAIVMMFVVPIGFPLALLIALVRSWRQSRKLWEQSVDVDASLADYHFARVHVHWFFIDEYRPSCFFFEPCDLLRKLALSGLLQFVHRGTAAQCFCGSSIAFVSFGIQQWLQPYRELESNLLKALVDAQIFLTFLISFIIRVLPHLNSSEPFDSAAYGWMLLGSMIVLLCGALWLMALQIRRRARFTARLSDNMRLSETTSLELRISGSTGEPGTPSPRTSGRSSESAGSLAPDSAQLIWQSELSTA